MLRIQAQVSNHADQHYVRVTTNDNQRALDIPSKSSGSGSSVNGGEFLFLALATCYCNDIYREAARLNMIVRHVQVEVQGEFSGKPGDAAENVTYSATVEAVASEEAILALMQHTDTVAEIQNTLRLGMPVNLTSIKAISVG